MMRSVDWRRGLLRVMWAGTVWYVGCAAGAAVQAEDAPDAAALVREVYASFQWINEAESFEIHSEYVVSTPEAQRKWETENRRPGPFGGGSDEDTRPSHLVKVMGWDGERVYVRQEGYKMGDVGRRKTVKFFDGAMAAEISIGADGEDEQYVVGEVATTFFEREIGRRADLAWGLPGLYDLWFAPVDVADRQQNEFMTAEDFEYEGEADVRGKRCHVVVSRAGHYRFFIDVAEGRLLRREWLTMGRANAKQFLPGIYERVSEGAVKELRAWRGWYSALGEDQQREVWRRVQLAKFEHLRRVLVQDYGDYREVAPGRWVPFYQTIVRHNSGSEDLIVSRECEERVSAVNVNGALPEEWFEYTFRDGVRVATDWRYDPPIRYVYRRDQTEAEREALAVAAKEEQAIAREEFEKRLATVKGMVGKAAPPLPQSGWLDGEALSWDTLRGRVVVLHFWSVSCAPCANDYPFLSGWHEEDEKAGPVVIGVHPATDDLAAVRAKRDRFKMTYPLVVDAAGEADGGLGRQHAAYGMSMWPYAVVIDTKGKVAGHGQVFLGDVAAQMRAVQSEL